MSSPKTVTKSEIKQWWAELTTTLNLKASVTQQKYGWAATCPPYCIHAIRTELKGVDPQDRIIKLQRTAQWLVKLHDSLKEEDSIRTSQITDKWVRACAARKSLLFQEAIIESIRHFLGEKTDQILKKFQEIWLTGIPLFGKVSAGGLFLPLSEDDQNVNPDELTPPVLPRKHWTNKEQREDLLRQAEAEVEAGRWERLAEPPTWFAIGFPVAQRGRNRLCVDYRRFNKSCVTMERIRLNGTRCIVEAIYECLRPSGEHGTPASFQNKSDITLQVAQERELVKKLGLSADDADSNVELIRSLTASLEELFGNQPDETEDDGLGFFVPVLSLHDLKGFYYQFSSRHTSQNVVALANPDEDSEGNHTWSFYMASTALFGALSSVQDCTFMSEVLGIVLSVGLGLPTTVYIDDITQYERALTAPSAQSLTELFLALANWTISPHKTESHIIGSVQSCVVALGISYTRTTEISLKVPDDKVQKCVAEIESAIEKLASGSITLKDLERLTGRYRFTTQFTRCIAAYVQLLDGWTEKSWDSRLSNSRHRAELKAVLRFLLEAVKSENFSRTVKWIPQGHFYGDAALERHQDLSKLLAQTREKSTDISEFKVIVAGVYISHDGKMASFSKQIRSIPAWAEDFTIQTAEAVAIDIGSRVFQQQFSKHLTIVHCDNMSDVFCLLKGSSKNVSTNAFIAAIHARIREWSVYWAWISTNRNIADYPTRPEKFELLEKVLGNSLTYVDDSLVFPSWDEAESHYGRLRTMGFRAARASR